MFWLRNKRIKFSLCTLNLSPGTLQFMQRSVLRIEKEKTAEEQQHIIDDEHWVLDLPETHQKE